MGYFLWWYVRGEDSRVRRVVRSCAGNGARSEKALRSPKSTDQNVDGECGVKGIVQQTTLVTYHVWSQSSGVRAFLSGRALPTPDVLISPSNCEILSADHCQTCELTTGSPTTTFFTVTAANETGGLLLFRRKQAKHSISTAIKYNNTLSNVDVCAVADPLLNCGCSTAITLTPRPRMTSSSGGMGLSVRIARAAALIPLPSEGMRSRQEIISYSLAEGVLWSHNLDRPVAVHDVLVEMSPKSWSVYVTPRGIF